jgi:dTDP-4-dehydrorhamnose 3,5-epimerase
MIFEKTSIDGVYNISIEKKEDDRGFFARIIDVKEFEEKGIKTQFVQSSISKSVKKGTFRGMHFQVKPNAETKLIRCIRGSAYTVIIDMRPNSPTFGKYDACTISANNYIMRNIPEGCANGTQILEDNSDLLYLTTGLYSPESERGVKWNDPFFNIQWPLEITEISEKDRGWKPFDPKNPLK